MKRLTWWQWALIGVTLALLAFFALVPEWKKQTIDTGFSDAALRNPFLATQRLAEQSNGSFYVTRELKITDDVLDQYNTLVLQNTYAMLNQRQVETLTTWLHQGGRLIISGYTPDLNARAVNDELFAHLNIEVLAANDEMTEDVLAGFLFSEQCGGNYSDDDMLYVDDYALLMDFYSNTRYYSIKRDQTAHALVRTYGAGDVVMMPDLMPFSNFNILCADHAEAVWALFNDRNTLWIWAAPASNWLKTLVNALPITTTITLLTLLLWLWRRAARVGPARQLATPERPAITQHHSALATKLWQQGDKEAFAELIGPLMRYVKRTLSHDDYQTLQPYSTPQNDGELLTLYKRLQQLGVLR
ncbi:DUF4350 domain-containing protein [Salinibius halmophilus]|uniref:DUF4350 domain-containing protein n=1 Tax=Salinibius halmophilus TaxID=1853216 RepID=UPI000E66E8FD|nr:DUF4350 domain-containing protein [Salinibius halmophilus]